MSALDRMMEEMWETDVDRLYEAMTAAMTDLERPPTARRRIRQIGDEFLDLLEDFSAYEPGIPEADTENPVSVIYTAMEDAATAPERPPTARRRIRQIRDEWLDLLEEFAEYEPEIPSADTNSD